MGGIATIQALREELLCVEIITLESGQENSLVEEAQKEGAIGSIPSKNLQSDTLYKAVLLAYNGIRFQVPAPPEITVPIVSNPQLPRPQYLTIRENELLTLLTYGLSNQQIADRMGVTLGSVKFRMHNIRRKLGTLNRTQTIVYALQHHLVADKTT